MLELLTSPDAWIAFLTLTALELVLGIDNIVFISILADKLPENQRDRARRIGLSFALISRIALLMLLSWIIGLTAPLFEVLGQEISGRDLILIAGGLFLLYKSTKEVHDLLEGEEHHANGPAAVSFASLIVQIIIIDTVFSLDSIITAVGLVDEIAIMVAAVIVAVGLMMVAAGPIGRFVSAHPTIKMLALSFLFMIGAILVADGLGHHVPKGYIYFAMAFSIIVELLNMRLRKRTTEPVHFRERYNERFIRERH
jgi:predicted tellurium resistance membrane protein TerC